MKKALGIDVGGTKISYAIIDENGDFVTKIKKTSTPKTLQELKVTFQTIISENEKDVDYIAFARAGAINLENTKVESSSPNMPEGYNTIEFTSFSKKPIYVENDANAAAWAEYKVGAAKGYENNVMVTLGTGIGGGIIINGEMLRGKSGRAGEIGHIKIYPDKRRKCNCGTYDCWEAYGSGTGLGRSFKEEALKNPVSVATEGKKIDDLTTYDLIDGFKRNDELCVKVMDMWHNQIITGMVTLNNIFDTEIFVISGGMGEFINTKTIEAELNKQTIVSPAKVVLATTGNNAGMLGCALLAIDQFGKKKK